MLALGNAPSRGPGRVGLLWGDETQGDTSAFDAHLLPPGQRVDLDSSATLGLTTDAPEVAAEGEGAGRVDVQGATGQAAWRRSLRPKHRDAVSAFFSDTADQD
ncbi:MAG: hypothetical protein H6828_06215 [Planctomycetes bacterium]|nr:hypothetical protein [Planctomycetota bacterium]